MTFITRSTIMGLNLGKAPWPLGFGKDEFCQVCLASAVAPASASGLWCVYELATFLRHGQAQQVKLFPVAMARVLLVIAGSMVPVTWIQLISAVETAPVKLC